MSDVWRKSCFPKNTWRENLENIFYTLYISDFSWHHSWKNPCWSLAWITSQYFVSLKILLSFLFFNQTVIKFLLEISSWRNSWTIPTKNVLYTFFIDPLTYATHTLREIGTHMCKSFRAKIRKLCKWHKDVRVWPFGSCFRWKLAFHPRRFSFTGNPYSQEPF